MVSAIPIKIEIFLLYKLYVSKMWADLSNPLLVFSFLMNSKSLRHFSFLKHYKLIYEHFFSTSQVCFF